MHKKTAIAIAKDLDAILARNNNERPTQTRIRRKEKAFPSCNKSSNLVQMFCFCFECNKLTSIIKFIILFHISSSISSSSSSSSRVFDLIRFIY